MVTERRKGLFVWIRGCFQKFRLVAFLDQVPRSIGIYNIEKELFSKLHLVVSVVLVASSAKNEQPPS